LNEHINISSWGAETGLWLEELASPFFILQEAGYQIDISSVEGNITFF
jgi:putative intracellular protease/amidase